MMEIGGNPGHLRVRKELRDPARFSRVGHRSLRVIRGVTSSARVPEDLLAVPARAILVALANLVKDLPPHVRTWRRTDLPFPSDAQAILPGSAARPRLHPESNRARDSPSIVHAHQKQAQSAPHLATS